MESVGIDDSVLLRLEKSLEEIDLYDDDDDDDDGDAQSSSEYDSLSDDDDHSPENELAEMMDSLVAELQSEIQKEIVNENQTGSTCNRAKPEKNVMIAKSDDITENATGPCSTTHAHKDGGLRTSTNSSFEDVSRTEIIQLLLRQLSKRERQQEHTNRSAEDTRTGELSPVDSCSVATKESATASEHTPGQRTKRKRRRNRKSTSHQSDTSVPKGKPRKPRTNKHKKEKRLEKLLLESAKNNDYSIDDDGIASFAGTSLWKMLYQAAFQANQR